MNRRKAGPRATWFPEFEDLPGPEHIALAREANAATLAEPDIGGPVPKPTTKPNGPALDLH